MDGKEKHLEKKDSGHEEEVAGIRVGHKKVPKLLIVVYIVLGIWAIGYAVFAPGKLAVSQTSEVSAQKGQQIVEGTCFNCHATGAAPVLEGVTDRLKDDEIRHILKNGRNTMPALGDRYNKKEIDQILAYLKTYK